MNNRVVITGLGIVSPNAIGVEDFENALRKGQSGIKKLPILEEYNFRCTVGGVPAIDEEILLKYLTPLELRTMTADGIQFGVLAALMAWEEAKLQAAPDNEPDWDSGCIFGAGMPGADVFAKGVHLVDNKRVKRLGSTTVPNIMSSGVSAFIGGKLGLGNQVTTNASACSTGTEALILGYDRIRAGKAKRMICGGCDSAGLYVRSGFDALRVLNSSQNDEPEKASRPLSASAKGFIPSGGAAALLLEEYESAKERNAPIFAELLGGYVNSGGHRSTGSMTAPNQQAVEACIKGTLKATGIQAGEIDAISGHLTATQFDPYEVALWSQSLDRKGSDFPKINALKSLIGHSLSAAGALEAAACVIQLKEGFLHPSINCEDTHPDILEHIDRSCIPMESEDFEGTTMISSSFGFGDVNSCVVLRK